jgi:hypothetical protein
MKMIFAAAQTSEERVRVAAYQCLVETASSYYEFLQEYIQLIFQVRICVVPGFRLANLSTHLHLQHLALFYLALNPSQHSPIAFPRADDGHRDPERAGRGGVAGSGVLVNGRPHDLAYPPALHMPRALSSCFTHRM